MLMAGAVLVTGCGGGEKKATAKAKLDGTYTMTLTKRQIDQSAVLRKDQPPPGKWRIKVSQKLKTVELTGPDRGGFSLGIKRQTPGRIVFAGGTGCDHPGDRVYDLRLTGSSADFRRISDVCSPPEGQLLSINAWRR